MKSRYLVVLFTNSRELIVIIGLKSIFIFFQLKMTTNITIL